MRKSSAIIMAIMLFAFGAIFAAGGTVLKPLAHDADVGKELTQMFEYRRDIVKDTRVRVVRRPGGEGRLAPEGRGVVVRLTPSPQIRRRRGGLRLLGLRAAQETIGRYPGVGLDWVEMEFAWGGETGDEKVLRTLFVSQGGRIVADPKPPLPLKSPS